MVTNGTSRQSSRPSSVAGRAASASRDERAAEDVRDAVGVDRDQADRPFALERTEPLDDRAGRQAEPAVARHLDRDEIAVHGAAGVSRAMVSSRPSCFLSIGTRRPPPPGRPRKMPSTRCLARSISLMTRPVVSSAGSLDAQQRAVADAGDFSGPGAAGGGDADDRRRAVGFLVPFGRARQQFAVAVAAGDVGEHDRRQGAGVMQPLAALLDVSVVGEFAQHALERRAVGILGAEGARDLARADLAGVLANEGEKLLARGEGGSFHRPLIGRVLGQRS